MPGRCSLQCWECANLSRCELLPLAFANFDDIQAGRQETICHQVSHRQPAPLARGLAACIQHCTPGRCGIFAAVARAALVAGNSDCPDDSAWPDHCDDAAQNCGACSHRVGCTLFAQQWPWWCKRHVCPDYVTLCSYPLKEMLQLSWQQLAIATAGCIDQCNFAAGWCVRELAAGLIAARDFNPRETIHYSFTCPPIAIVPVPRRPNPYCTDWEDYYQFPAVIHFPNPDPNAKVLLGADPEFELVRVANAHVVPADKVVPGGITAQIGMDGTGEQVEFRPGPGTPEQLVENFRALLKEFYDRYGSEYILAADGNVLALGGHIHISALAENGQSLLTLPPAEQEAVILALDAILGRGVRWGGQARGRYAERRAWRRQPHGIEYRTPPACIFSTPALARAVLEIAHMIVTELVTAGEFRPAGFLARISVTAPDIVHEWAEFAVQGPQAGTLDVLYYWGIKPQKFDCHWHLWQYDDDDDDTLDK